MHHDRLITTRLTRRNLVTGATGLLAASSMSAQAAPGANCARTSVGFTALPDLGSDTYHGFQGGLYPGGANTPPAAYTQDGLAHAAQIQPLNAAGQPASSGRVVLLSIGMSNATQEFSTFQPLAAAEPRTTSQLTLVDGAQGGQDAELIKAPAARYWLGVEQRLQRAAVTAAQVQVIWLKEAIKRPTASFPADAQRLHADLQAIVTLLATRFPHLQLIYLASRTYGGYATTPENPEPFAYESGFAVQWLIADRIKSGGSGPWLGWGPYLWTDGTRGRRDGLVWTCADVEADGTHPSASGRQKVAHLLLDFFTTDPTATPWFLT